MLSVSTDRVQPVAPVGGGFTVGLAAISSTNSLVAMIVKRVARKNERILSLALFDVFGQEFDDLDQRMARFRTWVGLINFLYVTMVTMLQTSPYSAPGSAQLVKGEFVPQVNTNMCIGLMSNYHVVCNSWYA